MSLSLELLDLAVWDRLDADGAPARAAGVSSADCLPPGVWPASSGMRRPISSDFVAFLVWQGAEFALIPGGLVTLGFDRSRPPELTQVDIESWELARSEYGEMTDHLDRTTTPLRQVHIAPFFLEVASREMHHEPGSLPDGTRCLRSVKITTRQVRERIHQDGFRLPTSDEWEHACRAGTRHVLVVGRSLSDRSPPREKRLRPADCLEHLSIRVVYAPRRVSGWGWRLFLLWRPRWVPDDIAACVGLPRIVFRRPGGRRSILWRLSQGFPSLLTALTPAPAPASAPPPPSPPPRVNAIGTPSPRRHSSNRSP